MCDVIQSTFLKFARNDCPQIPTLKIRLQLLMTWLIICTNHYACVLEILVGANVVAVQKTLWRPQPACPVGTSKLCFHCRTCHWLFIWHAYELWLFAMQTCTMLLGMSTTTVDDIFFGRLIIRTCLIIRTFSRHQDIPYTFKVLHSSQFRTC